MNTDAQCERSGDMCFVDMAVEIAVIVFISSLQVGNGASYASNSVIPTTR
jgi:hypothetical protein